MNEQKKVIDIICRQLTIDSNNVFHVAVLPKVFMQQADSEIKSIVSWEEIVNAYQDRPNYFLDVLKYAVGNYSRYVSTRSKAAKYDGLMTGLEIYDKSKNGTLDVTLIGRGNILDCKKQLAIDIKNNDWEFRKYKISNAEVIPNKNWCLIEDFIKLIEKTK